MSIRIISGILKVLVLTSSIVAAAQADPGKAPVGFSVGPTDAAVGPGMPAKYMANAFGCTGGNTSPALAWRNPPKGTKSFVVTLFDRDEKSTPSGWWHWAVYNLPATTTGLAEGAGAEHGSLLPTGGLQGRTDLGNLAYHGPCPAKGDAPHRYTFTVYALSVEKLPVEPGATSAMITSTAQDSLLGKAVFVAHVGR